MKCIYPCDCGGRKGWTWTLGRQESLFWHEGADGRRVEEIASDEAVFVYDQPFDRRTTGEQGCDAWLDRWVAALHWQAAANATIPVARLYQDACPCGGERGWDYDRDLGKYILRHRRDGITDVTTIDYGAGYAMGEAARRGMGLDDYLRMRLGTWSDELHGAEAYAGRAISRLDAASPLATGATRARESGDGDRAMTMETGRRNEGRRQSPGEIRGNEFVVTGAISGWDRAGVEAEIRKAGGYTRATVRDLTAALIVGDRPGPSKLAGAQRHGVPEIDEQGFFALWRASDANPQAIPMPAESAPAARFNAAIERNNRAVARARARALTDPPTPATGPAASGAAPGPRPAEASALDRLLDASRERRGPRDW